MAEWFEHRQVGVAVTVKLLQRRSRHRPPSAFCQASVSAVAFTTLDGEAICLPGQPLHTCIVSVGRPQGFFCAIAFKVDVITRSRALECTSAIKIHDSDFVAAVRTGEVEIGSFWAGIWSTTLRCAALFTRTRHRLRVVLRATQDNPRGERHKPERCVSHNQVHSTIRPACLRILLSVPGAKSSDGFPGTVTFSGGALTLCACARLSITVPSLPQQQESDYHPPNRKKTSLCP
jgi:hypothetical protein